MVGWHHRLDGREFEQTPGVGVWTWTGRPDVLQSMGLQRVEHNWVIELNWDFLSSFQKITCSRSFFFFLIVSFLKSEDSSSFSFTMWRSQPCLISSLCHSVQNTERLLFWGFLCSKLQGLKRWTKASENVQSFLPLSLFGLCHMACGILVSLPGLKPVLLAVKAWSPNHWPAGEFLQSLLKCHPRLLSLCFLVIPLWQGFMGIFSFFTFNI